MQPGEFVILITKRFGETFNNVAAMIADIYPHSQMIQLSVYRENPWYNPEVHKASIMCNKPTFQETIFVRFDEIIPVRHIKAQWGCLEPGWKPHTQHLGED